MVSLVLSACAAAGALRVVEHPEDTPLKLSASDGSSVAASEWLPQGEPRAVIVALHGFGDYGASTFRKAAEYWASRGIATIAPDQRGFGRNVSRGHWPGADALLGDARAYVHQIRSRYPCNRIVLLGHSMGGGVALGAARKDLDADGLILAAPAIWGGEELNPIHRLAAWAAATVVPEQRFSGKGVVRIQASDNIEALRALGRDPYYVSPPSARELFGLVRVADRAHTAAPFVGMPSLLLLGKRDQIVPNDRVEKVFAQLKGRRTTKTYPEGWHLLFRDLQAARVWKDVAEWTLSVPTRCGGRA